MLAIWPMPLTLFLARSPRSPRSPSTVRFFMKQLSHMLPSSMLFSGLKSLYLLGGTQTGSPSHETYKSCNADCWPQALRQEPFFPFYPPLSLSKRQSSTRSLGPVQKPTGETRLVPAAYRLACAPKPSTILAVLSSQDQITSFFKYAACN